MCGMGIVPFAVELANACFFLTFSRAFIIKKISKFLDVIFNILKKWVCNAIRITLKGD